MRKSKSGFTIVELLIVIVVIGILAAITIVAYNGVQQRGRDAQRKSDIATITKALELYYIDNGQYPSAGGSTIISNNWSTTADASWQNLQSALSTYVSRLPADPTSTPSTNVTASTSNGYDYAYYTQPSTNYCGVGVKQFYLLVYRLESSSGQEDKLIGNCSGTTFGPYSGASNYRLVK